MNRVKWRHNIRFRLPAILVLILLIPILFFWNYFARTSREHLLQNAANSIHTNIYGSSLLLDSMMREASAFSQSICSDTGFIRLVERYLQNGSAREQAEITLALSQYVGERRDLDAMYLIVEDAQAILTTWQNRKVLSTAEGEGAQLHSLYRTTFMDQIGWYTLPDYGAGGQGALSCVRPVQVSKGLGHCSLVLSIKRSAWEHVSELSVDHGALTITQYDGRVLLPLSPGAPPDENVRMDPLFSEAFSSTNDSGYYRFPAAEGEQLVVYYNGVEGGWKYLAAVPMSSIFAGMGSQVSFALIALVLGVVSVVLGSSLLFANVVKPIRFLMERMKDMEGGELETLPEVKRQDEIGALLRSYNQMIVKLKDLINEVYVQQLLRKQAQLTSLQSQMDEHFLYNTINTVYCEACREQAHNTASMLIDLSKYYRLSLAEGKDMVPLDEVVELVRAYLRIQILRFGDNLRCQVETFPGMEQYMALKYLFQPIVENAIVHGFERQTGEHLVRISFSKEDALLRFEVTDDGAGFPPARLEEITRELATFRKAEGGGFALKNVQEQIRMTYGEQYRIMIESEEGRGTRVSFSIPLVPVDTLVPTDTMVPADTMERRSGDGE